MNARCLITFLTVFLASCAFNSPATLYKESLRTDGIYRSKEQSKDGDTFYIRFYVSPEGEKYFKSANLPFYTPQAFNNRAEVYDYFSVDPDKEQLRYEFNNGVVQVLATTDMKVFTFVPDQ